MPLHLGIVATHTGVSLVDLGFLSHSQTAFLLHLPPLQEYVIWVKDSHPSLGVEIAVGFRTVTSFGWNIGWSILRGLFGSTELEIGCATAHESRQGFQQKFHFLPAFS